MAEQGLPDLNISTIVSNTVLENVRWIALFGQLTALTIVYFGFGYELPIYACLLAVAASALVGVWQGIATQNNTKLSRRVVLSLLTFDTLQLAVLIYLTGGLVNPFAILLIAPVTVSATVLPQRDTALLAALVAILATYLMFYHMPLPWGDAQFVIPDLFVAGLWSALVLTTFFVAVYAGIVSRQSRNLARGLADARLTMAREHQMVALGSLATAAAHKLGSPLNTITLIAHELGETNHKLDAKTMREDIIALKEEAERCRKILAELNKDAIKLGQEADDPLPIKALVASLIEERFEDSFNMISISSGSDDGGIEPLVIRKPELLHPLETTIENAVQFARRAVVIKVTWTTTKLNIVIEDDGPGFQSAILAQLGDPYNSSRKDTDGHMGLGVFIALTMVEQLGGKISLTNRKNGGARVAISYPREKIEVINQPPLV